jgi:mannose-6-phosphate isomerase
MNYLDDESGKVYYERIINESVNLASCQYFTTNILELDAKIVREYVELDSFVILMNIGGECVIYFKDQSLTLNKVK